jgi:hypothetical protein
MKKESLKYLSKDELIEIIMSDKMLEHKAFRKLIDVVAKRIYAIIDKQEKCSPFSDEYQKLEKEYEKWTKIQENL